MCISMAVRGICTSGDTLESEVVALLFRINVSADMLE